MDNLLKGVMDAHIHCAPDIVPRALDDLKMAREAHEKGMYGFVIKSHYEPTAGRAALLNQLYPDLHVIGSITLNSTVGGINPMAVENAARMGARVVWFPTFDTSEQLALAMEEKSPAVAMQRHIIEEGMPDPALDILDDRGKLTSNAHNVLKLVAEHDLVLASGHLSKEQSYKLFSAAREHGVKRMVLTHADCHLCKYSVEEQRRYIELGVKIEYSYVNVLFGTVQLPEVYRDIRAAGIENVIYSTDMGQKQFATPVTALGELIADMLKNGFTENEIDILFRKNPISAIMP